MSLGRRGSILVQVLVTTALMAIISVSVLRMRLQPAVDTANTVSRIGEHLSTRSVLNRLTESWTRLGTCASDPAAGLSCTGVGCNCTCRTETVVVNASPQGSSCIISVKPEVP